MLRNFAAYHFKIVNISYANKVYRKELSWIC